MIKKKRRFSPQQVADALVATRGNMAAAARALGCCPTWVRNYVQWYPTVREVYEQVCQRQVKETGQTWRGIPRRYSPQQVAEALLASEGNAEAAARALGCDDSTVHDYIRRDPTLRDVYERARETRTGPAPRYRGGSRRRYTPEQVAEALRWARGNQNAASRALECCSSTIGDYIRRYPEVREAYDEGRRCAIKSGRWPTDGNRPRYTPEQVAEAVRKARGNHSAAARALHCNPKLIAVYAERHPAVREALEETRARIVLAAENRIERDVIAGKWKAVSFVLRTLGKDRGYTTKRGASPRLEREHDELWRWIQEEYARHEAKRRGENRPPVDQPETPPSDGSETPAADP